MYVNGVWIVDAPYGWVAGVDLSGMLHEGNNSVRFVLTNDHSGYTYGFQITAYGKIVFQDTCGTVGVIGCRDNDQTVGVVYDKKIGLEVTIAGTPTRTPTPTTVHPPTATRTPTPVPTETPTPADDGDANGDGVTNAVDGALVLQYSAGMISSINQNADVNRDGRVDAVDTELILQFVAGLVAHLPI